MSVYRHDTSRLTVVTAAPKRAANTLLSRLLTQGADEGFVPQELQRNMQGSEDTTQAKTNQLTDEQINLEAEKVKTKYKWRPKEARKILAKAGNNVEALADTIEDLVEELNEQKQTGFRAEARQNLEWAAERAQLIADKESLETQVSSLTSERDDFRGKYETTVSQGKLEKVQKLYGEKGLREMDYTNYLLSKEGRSLDLDGDALVVRDDKGAVVPWESVFNTELYKKHPVIAPTSPDEPVIGESTTFSSSDDDVGKQIFQRRFGKTETAKTN